MNKNVVFPGNNGEFSPKTSLQMLRLDRTMSKTGLSRSTIYALLDPKSSQYDSSFPLQVNLGTKAVAWVEAEIDAWLQSRIDLSRRATGGQNV